jgi:hypothetical protein
LAHRAVRTAHRTTSMRRQPIWPKSSDQDRRRGAHRFAIAGTAGKQKPGRPRVGAAWSYCSTHEHMILWRHGFQPPKARPCHLRL